MRGGRRRLGLSWVKSRVLARNGPGRPPQQLISPHPLLSGRGRYGWAVRSICRLDVPAPAFERSNSITLWWAATNVFLGSLFSHDSKGLAYFILVVLGGTRSYFVFLFSTSADWIQERRWAECGRPYSCFSMQWAPARPRLGDYHTIHPEKSARCLSGVHPRSAASPLTRPDSVGGVFGGNTDLFGVRPISRRRM